MHGDNHPTWSPGEQGGSAKLPHQLTFGQDANQPVGKDNKNNGILSVINRFSLYSQKSLIQRSLTTQRALLIQNSSSRRNQVNMLSPL